MKTRAFTLIELLIVVAIIAILAAIAVPNFLEAQTRSKVSRSRADIRTLATAIESYIVDHNGGPSDRGNNHPGRPYDVWGDGAYNFNAQPQGNFTIGFDLTTPIAYLSAVGALTDTMRINKPAGAATGREYYQFYNPMHRQKVLGTSFATPINRWGNWIIMGAGPDKFVNNAPRPPHQDYNNAVTIPRGVPYDPTNGTVSNGDIYRSHKFSEGGWVNPGPTIAGD